MAPIGKRSSSRLVFTGPVDSPITVEDECTIRSPQSYTETTRKRPLHSMIANLQSLCIRNDIDVVKDGEEIYKKRALERTCAIRINYIRITIAFALPCQCDVSHQKR